MIAEAARPIIRTAARKASAPDMAAVTAMCAVVNTSTVATKKPIP
jgi:hypothetical protein